MDTGRRAPCTRSAVHRNSGPVIMHRLLLILLITGIAGCEPAAVIDVGTGYESFESLTADRRVELINGPQGGYHVLLAVRCQGCDAAVHIRYGIRDLDSNELLTFDDLERSVVLEPREGWAEYAPLVSFLRENDPSQYRNRDVLLWAEVTDSSGVPVEAMIEAVIAAE